MEQKPNALALANYILELAKEYGAEMQLLKLLKLVYIAHGFILALLNRSALNPRFDVVEAWQYGPVIPSVYHSFKSYGKSPITAKTTILRPIKYGSDFEIETPELEDESIKQACRVAFNYFHKFTGGELVDMLHQKGTPWDVYYERDRNNIIPDEDTQRYYTRLVDKLLKHAKREHDRR